MKQPKEKTQYVICIQNKGCDDLELGKVYQVIEDAAAAAQEGYLRVVDESGEDYLYPANNFVDITLPRNAERALFTTPASIS